MTADEIIEALRAEVLDLKIDLGLVHEVACTNAAIGRIEDCLAATIRNETAEPLDVLEIERLGVVYALTKRFADFAPQRVLMSSRVT